MDGSREREKLPKSPVERTLEKAEKQAVKTERHGAVENEKADRTLMTTRSPSAERTGGTHGTTLPVVEEAGESGSHRSGRSAEREKDDTNDMGVCGSIIPHFPMPSNMVPYTEKENDSGVEMSRSSGREKELPPLPTEQNTILRRLMSSPDPIGVAEEEAVLAEAESRKVDGGKGATYP
jgi:hypothetical protein